MTNPLKDKVVVVTGAGSGLGRALAVAFAGQGCHVAGIGRHAGTLEETAGLIEPGHFSPYVADVSVYDDVQNVITEIFQKNNGIDIVFNNAAVYPKRNFLQESPDEWQAAMAINVNGVAYVCKAVLPAMIKAGFGRIYNVGSFADISPIADSAAYSASKGALRSLTKGIAADLHQVDGDIEVHEWIPGHLNTQMSGYTGIDPARAAEWAVAIAKQPHARTRNCIFENDREWLPPRGLRQRVRDKVMGLLGKSG